MSEETITVKKETLWKYSTFVLAALLIIGGIIFFTSNRGSPTGNAVANNNAAANTGAAANAQQGTGDFSFISDSSLYPYAGPSDAKDTVIEFFDFQCPYCAIASGLPDFAKQYATQYADLYGVEAKLRTLAEANKIKLVFGTVSFLGEESGYAGEAGLCANDQGKFEQMYDTIYTAHDGKEGDGKFSKDNLKKLAASVSGLDQGKFASCLDSSKYAATIQKMSSDANTAGISGIPTFIVDGQLMSGSWSQISASLQAKGVSI